VVQRVARGGGAEAAGVRAGDRLIALGGVTLLDETDLFPAPGRRSISLELARAEHPHPLAVTLNTSGFRPLEGDTLLRAALMIAIPSVLLVVLGAPLGGRIRGAAGALAARLRRRSRDRARPLASGVPALSGALCYVVFAALGAALAAASLGYHFLAPELDVLFLYAITTASVVVVSFVAGGYAGSGGRWSPLRAVANASSFVAFQVPIIAAFAAVVVSRRSVHFSEIVGAQGGLPWHWGIAAEPASLLAFLAVLAALAPKPAGMPEALAGAATELSPRGPRSRLAAVLFVTDWSQVLVVCSVAASMFLGGPRVPGASDGQAPVALLALGGVLQIAKALALAAVVYLARWATRGVRAVELMGTWARVHLPLSAGAVALALVWGRLPDEWQAVRHIAAWIPPAVVVGACSYFAVELMRQLRSPRAPAGVNPWL
jgi:NADH:ubiquinone oxidoreductase subunit H